MKISVKTVLPKSTSILPPFPPIFGTTVQNVHPPSPKRTKYRLLPDVQQQKYFLPPACTGLLRTTLVTCFFLLKVVLLLATCLLLLTALSILIPLLFGGGGGQYLNTTVSIVNDAHHKIVDHNAWLLAQFVDFQKNFLRFYKSEEERWARYRAFVKNMHDLEERMRTEGTSLTQWGITQFFDWTDEEMAKLLMSPKLANAIAREMSEKIGVFRSRKGYKRPKQWDWREKGVVTHAKNQLKCGSCWAFAAVAVVESLHAIRNGTLVSLSEQQMIDCDLTQNGCEGGFRPNAFRYVRDNGLLPDSVYPYRGNDGSCRLPTGPIDPKQRVFVDDFKVLQSGEEQIADWVAENGPVSFGMNVTKGMYQYIGGIFSPSADECAHRSMGSHAMEVVGYGEQADGVPYWIMKNSWGTGYGVNGGYLLMRRGVNACGLTREVYTALINKKRNGDSSE